MKYENLPKKKGTSSRAPQGARGLKFIARYGNVPRGVPSRPARGARIEIIKNVCSALSMAVAPRKGRED